MSEYLTVTEVAAILGLNRRTVQDWIRRGRLEGRRTPGGHWRVERAALENCYVNATAFAALVGVHRVTVRRWAEAGKIECRRSAGDRGDWLVPLSEVGRVGARSRRSSGSAPAGAAAPVRLGRQSRQSGLTERTNG